MVSYVQSAAQGPNATVTFQSSTTDAGSRVQRFSQCLADDSIPADEVCLAPRPGPSGVISQCQVCLSGYASEKLLLQTTVPFADDCTDCPQRYDATFFDSHKVFPVTNHHSPVVTMLPVVTVPLLEGVTQRVSVSAHAVDEDGLGRPIWCRSSSSCNNIEARWDLGPGQVDPEGGGISSSGLVLEFHSDAVAFGEPAGNWVLEKRDDGDGGGLRINVGGPLREGALTGDDALQADALYPGRISVDDIFGVQVTMEFMLKVCGSVVPYQMTSAGIALFETQGQLAPIMVGGGQERHERLSGRHVCYPDRPCQLTVSAVAYDSQSTDGGFFLSKQCTWGPSRLSEEGSASSRCVDNVRSVALAPFSVGSWLATSAGRREFRLLSCCACIPR